MVDIGSMTFEQMLKKNFGPDLGQDIINVIQEGIDLPKKPYELKKSLVELLALSGGEDPEMEKNKIKAATTLNAYWVWIVLGMPPPPEEQF